MKRILVYDHDENISEILEVALKYQGYLVEVAKSIAEIGELIDFYTPDLVILDVKHYGKACLDCCREIKQKFPDLPVLALSCDSNISERYSTCNFDDFVAKPFDLEHLFQIVERNLNRFSSKN